MNTIARTSKTFSALTLSGMALLAFTACGSNEEPKPTETTTVTAESTSSSEASKSSNSSASESTSSKANDDDAVFAAIDSIEEKYPNGTIVSIDRDDNDTQYDFDVIQGDQSIEAKVNQNNEVAEEEKESADTDDTQEASDAKVTAREAVEKAAGQAEGQSVDDVELEKEGDKLLWQVDFDDQGSKDGKEVHIDATSGDVVAR